MARPSKAVEVMSKHLTKEEIKIRSENQEKLFNFIIDELKASNILSNLDRFILTKCVIAIDRLQYIENIINKNVNAMLNKDLMSTKDKYDKDFFRCCNELCLSPQSRAKISNINQSVKDKEEDPLLKVLRGE